MTYGKRLSKTELAFCIICFLLYFTWAATKPFDYAPDEAMRYDVTLFLFDNNRLPVGDELLSHWGFSYAHIPAVLSSELGCVFMKLASVFTNNDFHLLLAARMVSVCCGVGSLVFLFKTGKQILSPLGKWVLVIIVALMPQFAFISSYVNNDIVAFWGVTMIIYAWVLGMQEMWNLKNATLLAVGISVCALAYYNSYAWILFSVFFFFAVYLLNKEKSRKIGALTTYVVAVVFLLVGYSFIRHLVLYGDLLGFETSHYYGEKYAIDSLKPSNRLSVAKHGVPLSTMLFDSSYSWFKITWKSFIAVFGYMSVWCDSAIYIVVSLFIVIGCIGAIIHIVKSMHNRKISNISLVFYSFMIACAIITVCLSIYNSYAKDFQPQGRYIYPAFPTLAIFVAIGWEKWLSLIKEKEHRYAACASICTSFAAISLYVFATVYLPS